MTVGTTQEEALAMLDDAMAAWLRSRVEDREAIPQPLARQLASGAPSR
jgi:predicted RNase H-like HicB family nuclease